MALSTTQIQNAYVAFFNRPADVAGLTYWGNYAGSAGDLLNTFAQSAEYNALYKGMNNTQLVNAVYQNLFGRSPDVDGLNYWVSQLDSGKVTIGNAANTIQTGAQGTDKSIIDNKVAAATAFTTALDTTPEIVGYAGASSATLAQVKAWLSTVTDQASSLTAAKDALLALTTTVASGAGGSTTGQTFTLTNGTDTATANEFNSGLVYTPGGNARINALQDEDTLTGTGTNPTLNATLGNVDGLNAGAQAAIVTPHLSGIETINVAFTGSGAGAVGELDLQDSTAPTVVNITRVSDGVGNATIDNLKAVPTDLSVTDSNNAQQSVSFLFTNGGAAGATDSTKLTLSNVNVNVLAVEENGTDGTRNQGIETLNLVSSGSANTITTLSAEDLATLNITGDQNLTIAGQQRTQGSLSKVDASALEGNLTFTVQAGTLAATPDGSTLGTVAFSLVSGKGDDALRISEQVGTNDSIDAGEGTDTLRLSSGANANLDTIALNAAGNNVAGVENIQLWNTNAGAGAVMSLRADEATGDQTIEVRNHNNDAAASVYNLVNLTAAEATSVSIAHSGNTLLVNPLAASNALGNNQVDIDVADGVTAAGLTIKDGVNNQDRFNFQLYTDSDRALTAAGPAYSTAQNAGTTNAVTSLTLTDSDTESNTVQLLAQGYLNNAAQGAGTAYTSITLKGGVAGKFLNLDATGNLYGYDNAGDDVLSGVAGGDLQGTTDIGAVAAERLSAATINASEYVGDVVVRVGDNFNSVTSAQTITMGSGNDTVIFDRLNSGTAGLSNADVVSGGLGSDTLVIDGNGVNVQIGSSEWTNVTGFETVKLAGNGANTYTLTLTDTMIAANAAGGKKVAIINDNDARNDAANAAAAVANQQGLNTGAESAATIDARGLSAGMGFSYNGEENNGITNDRFIFSDKSIDGTSVIDGGANDNNSTNNTTAAGAVGNLGNADVVEVRNSAQVTYGDLAGITNVGRLEFTTADVTTTQNSVLELNDAIVDAMVDSYQASVSRVATVGANVERLQVSAVDSIDVATLPNATHGLTLSGATLTDKSEVNLLLGRGTNNVTLGAGNDNLVLLGNFDANDYAAGTLVNGIDITRYHTNIDRFGADGIAGTADDAAAQRGFAATRFNLGNGTDTLTTYGAIDLTTLNAADLATVENFNFLSNVRINASALLGKTVTISGAGNHTVQVINDLTAGQTLNLNAITVNGGNATIITYAGTGAGAVTGTPTAGTGTTVTTSTATGLPTGNASTPAATANYTLTAGIDKFNGTSAAIGDAAALSASFAGVAGTAPLATESKTISSAVANLTNLDALNFGTATADTLTFTDANTYTIGGAGAAASTDDVINGATVTGLEVIQLANVVNNFAINPGQQAISGATGLKVVGGSAQDLISVAANAATATAGATLTVEGGGGQDQITFVGDATGVSVDGGTDNDNVIFASVANLTSAASVVGGSGTDVVKLTGAVTVADTDLQKVSAEHIWLSNAGTNSITLSSWAKNAGVTQVTLAGTATATVNDLFMLGVTTNTLTVTGGAGVDTLEVASRATFNKIASFNGGANTDILKFTAAETGIVDADLSKLTSVETLTLTGASSVVLGTNATTAGIATVVTGNDNTSITSTQTALTVNAAALTGAATTGLTLLGSANYTVTNVGQANPANVVATGSTGTLNVTFADDTTNDAISVAAGNGNVTIVGGAAADTITVSGLATASQTFTGSVAKFNVTGGDNAQTIVTGVGADTITGGAGADALTGGAGADSFVYAAVANSAASVAANTTVTFDTISDFATTSDKINLAAINATLTGAAAATGITVTTLTTGAGSMSDTTIADFSELVTAAGTLVASAAGAAGAATGLQAYVIDLTGNTGALGTGKYLLVNDADTAMDAGDLFIQLIGTSTSPVAGDFTLA